MELRFTALQIEGRFEEMWTMLAEDAQRSWGSRDAFVREMHEQSLQAQVLEAEVAGLEILPQWSDSVRRRSYRNVARLAMRYRIRHQEEEIEMRKDVHLVPAAGGWRTLSYGPVR